jgi:magnesium chelatase family protein
MLNGVLPPSGVARLCDLDAAGRPWVTDPVDRGGLSARAVHQALRVARTIAELAGNERVEVVYLGAALQYLVTERSRRAHR